MSQISANLDERIDQAITKNPHRAGRKLRFETEGSRVVLNGTVASFFQKQMAQEALRRVDGVKEIENQLEVIWS
jgi:osmotically-inducible protein OsmY